MAALAPDESNNKFIILRTLGKGSFGKVKEARHVISGEKIAIKILKKDMLKKEDDMMRIRREIDILRRVRHPNIIQLYEVIETSKYFFFVMECAEKGELSEYIETRTKLEEKDAARFFRQLASAITYLHGIGCAHRDVKPSNILLDWKLNIKVIDFGLGNVYDENEKLKTACGSPCYAAPEIIAGQLYDPAKVDIWSSGITLFAMLCGYLPFDEESKEVLYEKILACKIAIPSHVSLEASELLKKLLNRDPAKRPSAEDILSHPWLKRHPVSEEEIPEIGWRQPLIELAGLKMRKQPQELLKMLEDNQHNKYTTLYYLLDKRNERGDLEVERELEDLVRERAREEERKREAEREKSREAESFKGRKGEMRDSSIESNSMSASNPHGASTASKLNKQKKLAQLEIETRDIEFKDLQKPGSIPAAPKRSMLAFQDKASPADYLQAKIPSVQSTTHFMRPLSGASVSTQFESNQLHPAQSQGRLAAVKSPKTSNTKNRMKLHSRKVLQEGLSVQTGQPQGQGGILGVKIIGENLKVTLDNRTNIVNHMGPNMFLSTGETRIPADMGQQYMLFPSGENSHPASAKLSKASRDFKRTGTAKPSGSGQVFNEMNLSPPHLQAVRRQKSENKTRKMLNEFLGKVGPKSATNAQTVNQNRSFKFPVTNQQGLGSSLIGAVQDAIYRSSSQHKQSRSLKREEKSWKGMPRRQVQPAGAMEYLTTAAQHPARRQGSVSRPESRSAVSTPVEKK